jgi:mannan endo-1,4-beta-mannosidase
VINIINNDLVVDGERIPIVFRPWHEMNGGWFWWGTKATSPDNYKKLYKLTVDYFKERTTSVMFCWSPNTPTEMFYYPGDDYVDVLGVDSYEIDPLILRADLALIVDYAQAHDKVAVLSETGNRTANGDLAASYWQTTLLPAILQDPSGKAQKIAWVLTWINASWSYPYVPHGGSSAAAKGVFLNFKETFNVIFGTEIPNESLYIAMDEPVATESDPTKSDDLAVFPVPSKDKLNIRLKNFSFPVKIVFYNALGKAIEEFTINKSDIFLNWNRSHSSGIYFIKASDSNRSITQKIIIE